MAVRLSQLQPKGNDRNPRIRQTGCHLHTENIGNVNAALGSDSAPAFRRTNAVQLEKGIESGQAEKFSKEAVTVGIGTRYVPGNERLLGLISEIG